MQDSTGSDTTLSQLGNSLGDAWNNSPEATEMANDMMGMLLGMGMGIMIFALAIVLFMIICMWKVFTKAGKPGWAILIPIYNFIILLQIAGKPWWWFFLMLIPLVNLIIIIIVYIEIAKAFGYGAGFAIGMLLLRIIVWPILAFGSSKYTDPAVKAAGA